MSTSTPVVAAGPQGGMGLDDHIYQRLLKERIIFLGSDAVSYTHLRAHET